MIFVRLTRKAADHIRRNGNARDLLAQVVDDLAEVCLAVLAAHGGQDGVGRALYRHVQKRVHTGVPQDTRHRLEVLPYVRRVGHAQPQHRALGQHRDHAVQHRRQRGSDVSAVCTSVLAGHPDLSYSLCNNAPDALDDLVGRVGRQVAARVLRLAVCAVVEAAAVDRHDLDQPIFAYLWQVQPRPSGALAIAARVEQADAGALQCRLDHLGHAVDLLDPNHGETIVLLALPLRHAAGHDHVLALGARLLDCVVEVVLGRRLDGAAVQDPDIGIIRAACHLETAGGKHASHVLGVAVVVRAAPRANEDRLGRGDVVARRRLLLSPEALADDHRARPSRLVTGHVLDVLHLVRI
eukprot:m.45153 g.45153  ORF g.45153 m.45153 type:complete len:352 (-) comp5861_c0_seq1:25-1080(-)